MTLSDILIQSHEGRTPSWYVAAIVNSTSLWNHWTKNRKRNSGLFTTRNTWQLLEFSLMSPIILLHLVNNNGSTFINKKLYYCQSEFLTCLTLCCVHGPVNHPNEKQKQSLFSQLVHIVIACGVFIRLWKSCTWVTPPIIFSKDSKELFRPICHLLKKTKKVLWLIQGHTV